MKDEAMGIYGMRISGSIQMRVIPGVCVICSVTISMAVAKGNRGTVYEAARCAKPWLRNMLGPDPRGMAEAPPQVPFKPGGHLHSSQMCL